MSLVTIVILGIGIILIYSAITGTMPKAVVLKAFGKGN